MIYTSNYFHGGYGMIKPGTAFSSFIITEENIKKISMLKSSFEEEGSYYNHRIQWLLSDNLHVVDDAEELSELFATMQFIVMTAPIKKDFLKKHTEFKDYHINMLRSLYLEFYEDDDISISMGFKRPFGNSHVLGDVREEMTDCGIIIDPESEDYAREDKQLRVFIDVLDDFFKSTGFDAKFRMFKYVAKDLSSPLKQVPTRDHLLKEWGILDIPRPHHMLSDWVLDLSEMRDIKINEILEKRE
jgi:hypothetical protein